MISYEVRWIDLTDVRGLLKEWKRDENLFDCDDHHHALYHIGRLFDELNRGHVWKNYFGCCRCTMSDIHYSSNGSSKKIKAALYSGDFIYG